LIVLALVAAIAAAFYLFLQSEPGRVLTARLIERSASSANLTIKIEGLSGAIPGAPEVAKLTLSDREGAWLVLHDVRLHWSPLALIGGDFVAEEISIARLEWLRLPTPSEEPADEEEGGIPSVAIDKLTIAAATIAPGVAGVGTALALHGAADTRDVSERAVLKLNLEELGQAGATLMLNAHYDREQARLDLDARIEDRAGGTLARMLELPPEAPLSLVLDSEGTLDNWRARLAAAGGASLNAAGEATIVRQGAWRQLALNFSSDIGAIGPARLRPLYQGRSTIELAAARSDTDALRIDRLAARTPVLALDASGAYDAAAKRADGEAALTVPDAAPLAPLIEGVRWRDLSLTAKLAGAWPTPALVVDAHAVDVIVDDLSAASLTAHLEATPDRQWDDEGARIALTARADANRPAAEDATLRDILGASARVTLQATLIDRARLTGIMGELATTGATLRFAGDADARALNGVVSLEAADLARAGFEGGALSVNATIEANLESGQWSAEGRGTARNVALGEAIDPLLAGTQDLAFALARASAGRISISSLTLQGERLSFIASGELSDDALNLDARATASNLSAVSPEHEGRAVVDVHVAGAPKAPRLSGTASLPIGKLFGRRVEDLSLALAEPNDRGLSRLTLEGEYDKRPVKGAAEIAWRQEGGARVDGLTLTLASLALEGDATVDGNGLVRGTLNLDARELADIAPFVGEQIAGAIAGTLRFDAVAGKQALTLALEGPRLAIETAQLDGLGVRGTIRDLFGAAALDVRATAASADFDGFVLEDLDTRGRGPLRALVIEARAMREGTSAKGRATLKLEGEPIVVSVAALDLTREDKTARLTAPVDIAIADGRVLISETRIAAGGGTLVVSGSAGRATDLALTANALPLWVAAFATDPLPVVGTATGTARVRDGGATSFDVKVANLAPEADPRLVRNVTLTATGRTDRAGVSFNLTLADARRTSFRANGRVPFAATGQLAIDAQGTADLALANIYLSVAGDRTRGALTASARITGTRAAPRIEGSGKIADGFFRSAASGFELKDVAASFDGSERRIAVTSLSAKTANGGTVTGRGDIAFDPANGFPVNLAVKAENAQLVSTELTTIIADVDGRMAGGLLRDAAISGSADVDLWEIRLPERLARPLTPIRVKHRNAPPVVAQTLAAEEEQEGGQSSLAFGLDVTVRAPRRVHVRGQGLQAEFGGEVKVGGTVANPAINGRFDLRRGSVELLTQRVALTRGRVSFTGGAIPTLDIAGEVRKTDVTATIAVKGRADAPEIVLSSTPTLPQDEILSRILFNKSTGQLSAFEAAQLAGAIARWSGFASGPGILDRLRSSLGIDTLSAVTDPQGGTAVSAGTYVGSGVYLGYVQGTETTAGRATVDVDLTDTIKLRGEAGPSGDTRLGVVAEWEY
jgi:translocation and assembly module TamB